MLRIMLFILLGILFYNSFIQFDINYNYLIKGYLDIYYTNIDLIFVPFLVIFFIFIFFIRKINIFITNNFLLLIAILFFINIYGLYLCNFSAYVLIIEFRTLLFIIFVETLFWFFDKNKLLINNKKNIRFYLFFILVFTQFISLKLNFFLDYNELFKGTVIDLVINNNFIFLFYDPVLPLLNISILQFIILILFVNFIFLGKKYIKECLNKKELYYLLGLLLLGLLFNIFLGQHTVLETDYHQFGYSDTAGEVNFLSQIEKINFLYYGLGFHDFLNLFTRFTINNQWNLFYTFGINIILNTFNIFVIFILSISLWKNKTIAFFNSIFYFTSIPILLYLDGNTTYTIATTFLMFLILYLNEFYNSNFLRYQYFYLAILSTIFLFYTHHQFILLPLIILLYFFLFFRKNILRVFLDYKKIFFYIITIFLLISVLYIKEIDSYLSTDWLQGKYEYYNVFNNLFSFKYIGAILFTKVNGFLSYDNNYYIIIIIMLLGIMLSLFLKKGLRIIILLLTLHYLLLFPHFYTYYFGSNLGISYINDTYNYFNSNLTDYYVKGSTTLFIYILFLGFVPYFLINYINNNKVKNIFVGLLVVGILSIPLLNYNKLNLNFNQQNNYRFVNYINSFIKDGKNVYGEDGLFGYNIGFDLHGNQIRSDFSNIDWTLDNYYYLGSYCYEYHNDGNGKLGVTGGVLKPGESCFIFNRNDIEFIPIIEKEFDCIPYDTEEICLQKKLKLGLYKMIKIHNDKNKK